jgi:iron complex outermembrane receptor protein
MYLRLLRRRRSASAFSRVVIRAVSLLAVAFGVLTAMTAAVTAQSAPPAPAAGEPLPPVVVDGAQKKPKKKAAAKKKSSSAATAAAPTPTPPPAAPATAISTAESSASPLYADPGPGPNLNVPNTTGSRLNMTPLQTPASVDIISGETARERGQDNIVDAITQNAPGVTSVSRPVTGSAFTARGFVGNNSITRLYDGTRLYPGTGGTTTFPFNMWSVERIEVMHGPASVLYGDGGVGGVTNVIPKKPITDGMFNEAQVYFDSNMARRASLDSGGALTQDLAYRINITKEASEGYVDNGDSENLGISGALRAQVSQDFVVSISHDYAHTEPMKYFGTPYRDGVFDPGIRDKNYNVANALIDFRDQWTQAKAELRVSDYVSLRNVAYMLNSRREFRNAESYFWDTSADEIQRSGAHIRQKQEQIGNRFDATVRTSVAGVGNEFVSGFDVNRSKFNYATYFGDPSNVDPYNPDPGSYPNPFRLDPRYDTVLNQYSLFAEDRVVFNKYLSVVGGVRWDATELDRNDLANGSTNFARDFYSFNWRVGAVVTPVKGFAFYGQYAEGSDPLNVSLLELSSDLSKLKMTTGRQYEVGVKQTLLGGKLEWSLAAYDIVKNDLLVRNLLLGANGLHQIGQQSSQGLEATVGVELGGGWRFDANGALLKARYDEFQAFDVTLFDMHDFSGNRPILVPEQTANLWLSWAFAQGWKADAGLQYVGASFENFDNTVSRPAYTIVNAGLQWKPTDKMTFDFRVENVFDELYSQYLAYDDPVAFGSGSIQGYLAPPRTFSGAMTVKF